MQRTSLSKIQLAEQEKKKMMDEIASFYLDERGEEVGMVEQFQLLDLFLDRLAPVIYNKALDDAQRWYRQTQENMESDYYSLYRDIR